MVFRTPELLQGYVLWGDHRSGEVSAASSPLENLTPFEQSLFPRLRFFQRLRESSALEEVLRAGF